MSERESYIDALVDKINEDFYTGEYVTEDDEVFKKYHVTQQDIRFETYLTDDELRLTVEAGVAIVEELKRINSEGFDSQAFKESWEEFEEESKLSHSLKQAAFVKNYFSTRKMLKIKEEISEIRRVGGAYEMIISNPVLDQTIFVVYAAAVDSWDENNFFNMSIYFIIRTIMRMNSIDLEE